MKKLIIIRDRFSHLSRNFRCLKVEGTNDEIWDQIKEIYYGIYYPLRDELRRLQIKTGENNE